MMNVSNTDQEIVTMSVTETIQQQIRNQISSAFEGNPNALDTTLAKLKQAGKTSAYNSLFATLTGAQGLLAGIELATGGAPTNILEPAALTARVNAIAANSIAPGYSLTASAQPASDALFAEKNAGTKLTTVGGEMFGLYVPGNTRRLTWNVKQTRTKYAYVNGKVVRVGTVTTTNTVWSDGSGPFVSYLTAAILNLGGDLIGLGDLADELAQLQAAIWSIADEVGAVAIGHDAVPASIIKQYPRGFAVAYDIDNQVIA